ncbi:MAG: shikimate kinase [Bacteroidota bacterium]
MKIFLIGYMGSGKSTVGKQLAEQLAMPLLDTDEMLGAKYGSEISAIFDTMGEIAFREAEHELLLKIIADPANAMVATGGGLPCFYNNMNLMKQSGITVYLKLTPDLLYERLCEETAKRPLLAKVVDLKWHIIESIEHREKKYRQAAFKINIEQHTTVNKICSEAMQQISKQLLRKKYHAETT